MDDTLMVNLKDIDSTRPVIREALRLIGIVLLTDEDRAQLRTISEVFAQAAKAQTLEQALVSITAAHELLQTLSDRLKGGALAERVPGEITQGQRVNPRISGRSEAARLAMQHRSKIAVKAGEPCPKCQASSGKLKGHRGRHRPKEVRKTERRS